MKIALFVHQNDSDSDAALELVKRKLSPEQFVVRVCPLVLRMDDDYQMPFIANEDNTPFFGLQGVRNYLDNREKYKPVLAEPV
ncbi:hypothetical protein [Roseateles toxinivorans]|uniref:hypothetical protein n=1 Tax=Roseateles toxinivorans TaxID=270368 RepID=UPI0010622F30|nr:hypothetical protein [Roseateles toxinivorans]